MSLREFEDFVYDACLVHEADPIKAWKKISKKQKRIADWLSKARQIHVTGPDTDLKLKVTGRPWINCDGHENFPDGEIFTAPAVSTPAIARGGAATRRSCIMLSTWEG